MIRHIDFAVPDFDELAFISLGEFSAVRAFGSVREFAIDLGSMRGNIDLLFKVVMWRGV